MRFLTTILIAFRALRRNTLRTFLAALGMIIGIGSVITMVSMGNGARAQIEASIAGLGENMIIVFPGSMTSGGMRGGWGSQSTLTLDDAEAIRNEVLGAIRVSPEVRDRQQVLANGLNWNTQILGESTDFPGIRAWKIAAGDFFTEADITAAAKVCVIGKTVHDQLFAGMDPVGQTLRVRNIPLRITGVLAPKGYSVSGNDQDDVIIVPYTTAMRRLSKRDRIGGILIQAQNTESMKRVQDDITQLLLQRRKNREPDFTVFNQVELTEMRTASSKTMTSLLGGVALVSLIVGGIGIMNIMLVSVTERTREIGIRLAVGAHGNDVLLQFLTEAVVLSLAGGAIGIVSGIGASEFVSWKFGWPSALSPLWMGIAVGGSAVVGILSGFYPALKAARLDPIEALRYE